ncbi:hypothetical protein SAY87_001887 [Trapa incisa]|uniref:Senescence regulator n=1 Tax=Trapa incisa TaxID=236973 RepID=A0AAN7PU84_9MYRT|nr:hypothetical protein SAY87_001887 [Trapa incisa]
MATSKACAPRPSYRFLSIDQIAPPTRHDSAFELDESDIYGTPLSDSAELRWAAASYASRVSRKVAKRAEAGEVRVTAASLPVNIPDWSKILRGEYRDSRRRGSLDDDSDGGDEAYGVGEGMRVPPHELMARTRMASLSVHEGRGRTLKGRDLSRVRNAIWEKMGFED